MRIPGIRRILRIDRGADGVRGSIDDEIHFHFDMTVERLRAGGMSPDAARAEAERLFGDVARARRTLESIDRDNAARHRRADLMDALRQDVRYAVRGLRRSPGFTAVVIATFALGIGANAAMFGVVDRLLLRPPSLITDPSSIVRIYYNRPGNGMAPSIEQIATFPSLVQMRERAAAFRDVAMYTAGRRVLGSGVDARQIRTLAASANFLPLLGIGPALGRFFDASEDRPPSGTHVAVVGYEFWQSEFGGAPILGRAIVADKVQYTIIGVAPKGFTGIDVDPIDVILPLSAAAFGDDPEWATTRNMTWVKGIARLKPGVNIAAAQAEANRVLRAAVATGGGDPVRGASIKLGPIPRALGPEVGEARTRGRVAQWLSGVSLALLLVACANVANLLLARAMRRRREIGVRLALGVSRGRLAVFLLIESLLLAAGGGLMGIGVAWAGGRTLQAALLPDAAPRGFWFDPHVAIVAAIAVLATGLVTGLAPVLHVRRRDLAASIKGGAREGALHRSAMRSGLTVVQTALSVVLLVGAGLFVRSLHNIRTLDYGYEPSKLMLVDVNTPDGMSREARLAAWERLLERARALPGVASASLSLTAPFWSTMSVSVRVPGRDSVRQTASGRPYINAITPDYFTTLGTRIVAGRAFTNADGPNAPRVAAINETLARMAFPGEKAVGKCIKLVPDSAPCSEVVAVVQDVRQRELRAEEAMQVYVPMVQQTRGLRVLVVRTRDDASVQRAAIQRALTVAEPGVGFVNIETLDSRLAPQVRPWTLGAAMFSAFGLLALATAAIGLYSVIGYGVTQRTHEFGVRAALGATEPALLRLVLSDAVRVAAVGLAIGSALAAIGTRWMGGLLFDVSRFDPAVFAVVGGTLLAAALAASLVPAWRASRVDPAAALRAE